MRHSLRFVAVLSLVAFAGAAGAASPTLADAQRVARELRWDDLVPKGWSAFKELRRKVPATDDIDSPEAMVAMREIWDSAPTVAGLDNTLVKLPGYVVPLEMSPDTVREFLLVPYFGACLHMPPPPANQIVHVVMASPAKGLRAMEVVWVRGTLRAKRHDSSMGASGYRIEAAGVEPYSSKR